MVKYPARLLDEDRGLFGFTPHTHFPRGKEVEVNSHQEKDSLTLLNSCLNLCIAGVHHVV